MVNRPLLTRQNAKTVKGEAKNWLTLILYLAPANTSGRNVCSNSTKGCRDSCLFTAGRGAYSNVREARLRKTREFYADRWLFMFKLFKEIKKAEKYVAKRGMRLAVRLNGTSDLSFENIKLFPANDKLVNNEWQVNSNLLNIMQTFPNVQFYDYTKNFHRIVSFLAGDLPANYHLTFSYSEVNLVESTVVLKHGGNVAIVTAKGFDLLNNVVPDKLSGAKYFVDGDTDDLRFLDSRGSVIILRAKGKAKKDRTGFVFRSPERTRSENAIN